MGKTAALFSLALFVGAQESGSGKETSELLRRVGYHLGMAFQLQDDLLDFFPENNQKGKPAFWDLCHGIYTLPVLFALKADPSLGPLVSECRTPGQGANLVSFIASSGGFKKTKEIADGHYIRALALLERIPQGETKQKLTIIIKKMMERRV